MSILYGFAKAFTLRYKGSNFVGVILTIVFTNARGRIAQWYCIGVGVIYQLTPPHAHARIIRAACRSCNICCSSVPICCPLPWRYECGCGFRRARYVGVYAAHLQQAWDGAACSSRTISIEASSHVTALTAAHFINSNLCLSVCYSFHLAFSGHLKNEFTNCMNYTIMVLIQREPESHWDIKKMCSTNPQMSFTFRWQVLSVMLIPKYTKIPRPQNTGELCHNCW